MEKWGLCIIRFLHLQEVLKRDNRTKEYMTLLYPEEGNSMAFERLWAKRIMTFLASILGVLLLALLIGNSEGEHFLKEGHKLSREQNEVELMVSAKEQGGEKYEEKVTLYINERKLSITEQKRLSKKVKTQLKKILPGTNENLENVTKKLQLKDSLFEGKVKLQWTFDTSYIKENGELLYQNIPEEGVNTSIGVQASCKNYREDMEFNLHLCKPEVMSREYKVQCLKEEIQKQLDGQPCDEIVTLPKKLSEVELSYKEKEQDSSVSIWILIVLPLLLPILWKEQMSKKEEERLQQLLVDYPEMIHKLMLLLGAGFTVKKAFERMVKDEEEKADAKNSSEIHYVYKELALVLTKVNNGVSWNRALENFGRRCELLPYLRFSTLLSQNMRKSSAGLVNKLEEEAMDSLQQRKELVKQMGEKASTKLLLPMGVMLGLVMAIIMVPAFMTM